MKGIFAAPSEKSCRKSFRPEELTKFTAEVRKFQIKKTVFPIYYCDAQHIVKDCDVNFLDIPKKEITTKFIPTTQKQCKNAVRNKANIYGRLVRKRVNEWVSVNTKTYHCKWWRDTKEKYVKFRVRKVEAMIEGDDNTIQQHITTTQCIWKKLQCRPKEQKLGWIIWNFVKHDSSLYHFMGKFLVHQSGNFLMISELGIGGSIIKKQSDLILLDNTYILKMVKNESKFSNSTKFVKFAGNFAKNSKANVQRDLMEGQIAREFMRESEMMTTIAAILCRMNADVHRLQLLNLHSFPDTVGEMLYAEKGMTITPKGDAYMVRQCKKILNYRIIWNKKLNNTCYQLYPVHLPRNKTKFLELSTRRILEKSNTIKCKNRQHVTYIRDINNEFWMYKLGAKHFRKVQLKDHYFHQRMTLPKLRTYTPKLLHYEEVRAHRTTLLDLLATQQENLETLTDLKESGNGSILKGIASAMGDAIETVTDSASNIFRLITRGTTDIANDTIQAVDGIGSALVDMVTFTGGPSNFVLYIIDLIIISYLTVQYIKDRRLRRPPPIPEHRT